ncbi:MAG: hypothetical protein UX94_C0003G0010 [Parcubacteria group bacterium GW2011_GWA2_47_21]|nr:MAG: hypothetical protein UX94_C0003G0010 [Parcubacteria group bacterium GW2011_GWA2_47_21]
MTTTKLVILIIALLLFLDAVFCLFIARFSSKARRIIRLDNLENLLSEDVYLQASVAKPENSVKVFRINDLFVAVRYVIKMVGGTKYESIEISALDDAGEGFQSAFEDSELAILRWFDKKDNEVPVMSATNYNRVLGLLARVREIASGVTQAA